MPYEKKSVEVNGYAMAYTDEGEGDPVVFLHGNATSSYMWRNIMPYLEGKGRLIAIDNIGQGDSAKLAHSGPEAYTLAEHQTFIDGTLEALGVTDNVTFVMHDWGGPLGLTWARRHEQSIKGLAFCETLVCDHASYEDYPAAVGGLLKRLRGPEGEQLVLEENFFVEKVFTAGVMRDIDDETMTEIRRPYSEAGEGRRATLTWPRQIPIAGEPKDVADLVEDQAIWMAGNSLPKLFINVEPGQIVFERDLEIIRGWSHLTEVSVRGLHHPQEDSPDDMGAALRDWYATLG
ncbi:MAG: haloalkane dehalogenase [Alphaproteobacteria bacterium]|nr:haloalkane dehalogenase [Alphaproteobacteria bacterium]